MNVLTNLNCYFIINLNLLIITVIYYQQNLTRESSKQVVRNIVIFVRATVAQNITQGILNTIVSLNIKEDMQVCIHIYANLCVCVCICTNIYTHLGTYKTRGVDGYHI